MTRIINLTFVFLFTFSVLKSQIGADYSALKSVGQLPREFQSTWFKNYLTQCQENALDRPRQERILKKQFYIKDNFWLYDLQHSGKVLFGDPVSKYVNTVVDSLFGDRTELRKTINVYIIKSSSFNAFATHQGNIYINMGLLARIHSEAELAFIISHEWAHYYKKHILRGYIQSHRPTSGQINTNLLYEDSIIKIHNYSQALEYQADTLGLDFYSQSNYSMNGAIAAIEFLKRAGDPSVIIPFDYSLLQINSIPFHLANEDSVQKRILKGKSSNEDAEVNNETHPLEEERRLVIKKMVERKYSRKSSTKFYLAGESEFQDAKQVANFELIDIMHSEKEYDDIIFHCTQLLKLYPGNQYLYSQLGKAIHSFMLVKLLGIEPDESWTFDDYPDLHRLSYSLQKFTKEELFIFDFWHLIKIAEKNPEQKTEVLNTLSGALFDLKIRLPGFYSSLINVGDSTIKMVPLSNQENGKWVQSALTDIQKNELFISAYNHSESRSHPTVSFSEIDKLPEGKTLILSAENLIIDFRTLEKLDLVRSEENDFMVNNMLNKENFKKQYNEEIISPYLFQSFSMTHYNDIALLKNYIDDLQYFKNGYSNVDQKEIKKIKLSYNARYILLNATFTGTDYADEENGALGWCSWLGTLASPFGAIFAGKVMAGEKRRIGFTTLVDLETCNLYAPEQKPVKTLRSHKSFSITSIKRILKKIG